MAVSRQHARRGRCADRVRPRPERRASIRCAATTCTLRSAAIMSARRARCAIRRAGTLVTNVSIEHRLSTDAGHAILDVPGMAFGPNFQPDELTRLTEGVVALVNGTVTGQGRINWARGGKVTSTGDFSTAEHGPRRAVRAGDRPHDDDALHRPARARDRAAPGRDGRVDQPRHPGRERNDHTTRCCPTTSSRSSAANGRSWAAG